MNGSEAGPVATENAYAKDVGRRLRDVRRQHGLSLLQVSGRSGGAFSPSILGAYERGERALSVGRLSGLAELYCIPAWLLLPQPTAHVSPAPPPCSQVTLDLTRLGAGAGGWNLIRRFATSVQQQRGDLNGEVLSLRMDDLRVMAALYSIPVETLLDRLRHDGILRHDPHAVALPAPS